MEEMSGEGVLFDARERGVDNKWERLLGVTR